MPVGNDRQNNPKAAFSRTPAGIGGGRRKARKPLFFLTEFRTQDMFADVYLSSCKIRSVVLIQEAQV